MDYGNTSTVVLPYFFILDIRFQLKYRLDQVYYHKALLW